MTSSATDTGAVALFLDRDGVINVDHGYVHRIDQFEFIDGIFDLARCAVGLGWRLIVTTNQSGIGRGHYGEDDFRTLTEWMCKRFEAEGAPILQVYHCPFHPQEGVGRYRADHEWRKPRPGMFLQAAVDHGLDLPRCVAIGDQATDMQAAAAAGIAMRLLYDPSGLSPDREADSCCTIRALADACTLLKAWHTGDGALGDGSRYRQRLATVGRTAADESRG